MLPSVCGWCSLRISGGTSFCFSGRTWINGRREGKRTSPAGAAVFSGGRSDPVGRARVDPGVHEDRRGGSWRPWSRRRPVRDGRAVPHAAEIRLGRAVAAARSRATPTGRVLRRCASVRPGGASAARPAPSRNTLRPAPAGRSSGRAGQAPSGRSRRIRHRRQGPSWSGQLVAAHRERFGEAPCCSMTVATSAVTMVVGCPSPRNERASPSESPRTAPLPELVGGVQHPRPDPAGRSASRRARDRTAAATWRRPRGPTSRPPAASEASGSRTARPRQIAVSS